MSEHPAVVALRDLVAGIDRITPALNGAVFTATNHGSRFTPEEISIEAELLASRSVLGVEQKANTDE